MKKTALITGTSTGIGRATALYFQQRGWNVVATMRTPAKETELGQLPGVALIALDVTKPDSIRQGLQAAIAKFGKLDAVVNNAGYALNGPFEAYTQEQIRRQFETNVFGLMEVCRQVLPHFRQNKAGVLVNVASMGGRLTFPLYSSYHSTKWAVEGFSESLHYELRPLGIAVKIDDGAERGYQPVVVDLLRATSAVGGLGLAADERLRAELDEPSARDVGRSATGVSAPSCAARRGPAKRISTPPFSIHWTRRSRSESSIVPRSPMMMASIGVSSRLASGFSVSWA